jgi:hypothetical protein
VGLIDVFNKRVICIDNSTNSTAYVVFNGKKLETYGEISFPGKDTYERIVKMRQSLEPLKDLCKDISDLYIEQTTFVQSQKTVILLALAEGATIASISNPNMNIHRISPLVWQKYIGNPPLNALEKKQIKEQNLDKTPSWLKNEYRRVRKQITVDYINKRFGIVEPSDNICDAFGLAVWASENR